jgi:hypothetical protein
LGPAFDVVQDENRPVDEWEPSEGVLKFGAISKSIHHLFESHCVIVALPLGPDLFPNDLKPVLIVLLRDGLLQALL